MANYKLAPHGGVVREADGAVIPEDTNNIHWLEYLAWVAAGGVADEASLTDLGVAKVQATRRVEAKALNDSLDVLGTPAEQIEFRAAEFEAMYKTLDPAVGDVDIPLLAARIGATFKTTDATAADVMATSKANRGAVVTIHATRKAELAAVAASVSVAECEAVAPGTIAVPEPV